MTEAAIKRWVEGTRPYNWLNQCAGLTMSICRHFGSAPPVNGHAYATATAAYEAATIESTDPSKAPAGAIHYWSYTTTISGRRMNFGHVVVDIRGKGTHTLSATRNASPMWGTNAGLISVARQTALIGSAGRYLGWSRKYGRNYYVTPLGSPAGGGSKPLEDDVIETINRKVARKQPQVLEQGKKDWLRLNDPADGNHVTFARGAQTIIGGRIRVEGSYSGDPSFVNGFPPVLQLELVADTIGSDNKVTASRVISRVIEDNVTAGNTFAKFPMPAFPLRANESLRAKIVVFDVPRFTITGVDIDVAVAK